MTPHQREMADAEEAQRLHDRTAAAATTAGAHDGKAGGVQGDGMLVGGVLGEGEGGGGGGSAGAGEGEEGSNDPELMCSQLMMEVRWSQSVDYVGYSFFGHRGVSCM